MFLEAGGKILAARGAASGPKLDAGQKKLDARWEKIGHSVWQNFGPRNLDVLFFISGPKLGAGVGGSKET